MYIYIYVFIYLFIHLYVSLYPPLSLSTLHFTAAVQYIKLMVYALYKAESVLFAGP